MDFPQSGFSGALGFANAFDFGSFEKKNLVAFRILSFHIARVKFGRSARFGLDGSLCLDSFRARRTKAKTQVGH
jgi:hypothetical protein